MNARSKLVSTADLASFKAGSTTSISEDIALITKRAHNRISSSG